MATPPSPASSAHDHYSPHLERTIQAVNWTALAAIAVDIYQASTFTWGSQLHGASNLVRFLKLHSNEDVEVVIRVPYAQEEGIDEKEMELSRLAMESEVATMEYVSSHSRVPVPRVIAYNSSSDGGGIGSPYMIVSKAVGTPLCSVWNEMQDEQREVVLRQVVDIILQLSSLRFDRIGAIFKGEGGTDHSPWTILPLTKISSSEIWTIWPAGVDKTFTSAFDYWIAYATCNIERIDRNNFGSVKDYDYVCAWLHRSLIPSLYNTSLDTKGFPINHSDFHSQNILIDDVDTPSPRITAILDWEGTSTAPTTSFAQYPLFIVDHPFWDDDHLLKPRNMRDQATFNRLMREAECRLDPDGGLPLSQAFEASHGVYLFEQLVSFPYWMGGQLFHPFFEHFFGEKETDKDPFSWTYYSTMINGPLKDKADQFKNETIVRREAVEILGEDLVAFKLTRSQFKALALQNLDKFPSGGEVRKWLDSKYANE
ncbi:hypothetical protein NLJ89_g2930 [Agrocybe chaxingu]|uniref:Aminoglycoside phosphotransferase domain-containing protein n=1 Tax=Agrocybe chaxingu TaxID=84603 RepID=A0A9W8K5M5_9AGAR|nr:hypothetical protein NLJ89_g2930 [Agrocybe chaxingu]